MSTFKTISIDEFNQNAFKLIGADWMLITAEKENKVNTMTASWGGLGVMWGKNVVYVVIRPQRYTKEFIDFSTKFSLSFFSSEYKETLTYLGKVSGRDEDKIKNSKLTVIKRNDVPIFEEAKLVMCCEKLFCQTFDETSFLKEDIKDKWYPEKDFHVLYIAEITDILTK